MYLDRRWAKRWLKFMKKRSRKVHVKSALQEALVEHGTSDQVTASNLRDIVGRKLGFVLEGRHRVAFDRALLQVTAKVPAAKRPRKKFKLTRFLKTKRSPRTRRAPAGTMFV